MTEAEWLEGENPTSMLFFIRGYRGIRKRVKQRKQRLFAVACCRRLQPLLDHERSRRCVEVAESVADDSASPDELRAAEADARAICQESESDETSLACLQLFWKELNGLHVSTTVISAVFERERRSANRRFEPLEGRRVGACLPEERAQCGLIRCIFGNPFRPVALDPSWRTGAVVALTTGIYEERAFERMPVLADALEDAGCANPDVLAHCRSGGPHARGCWVVDLLLGKA